MSHPSLHFIRFLLAEAWNDDEPQSLSSINTTLQSFHLFPLSEDAYNEIVLAFSPPQDFDFDDRNHGPSREFMRAEKIANLWDADCKDEQRVLSDLMPLHWVRERVDLLLLGNVKAKVIAKWATRWATALPHVGRSGEISAETIHAYRHYFMNPWVCSLSRWHGLLRGHPLEDQMMAALRGGSEPARYWAGVPMKIKDKRALLEDSLVQLHQRLVSLRSKPTTKTVVESEVKLAVALERMHERLYGSAETSAADRLLEFSRHIKLVKKDPGIKSIQELVGPNGSYSGDGRVPESV